MEQDKVDFIRTRDKHKKFYTKTKWMMYVLVYLSVLMAVFFYIISVGSKLFIVAILLLMAAIGAIIARDARRQEAELDDFALYYGMNKIKNGKEKI